jgi:hypothetical protein
VSDTVTVKRPPPLKPLTSALELKDATVRDYRKIAERSGRPVDMRAIEALAVSDCQVYEGVSREAPKVPKQTPEQLAEVRRIRRESREREQAAAEGIVPINPGMVKRRRVKQMHTAPEADSRWHLAMVRIARLLKGIKPAIGHYKNIDEMRRVMFEDCEVPHLAAEIDRIRALMVVRDRMPRPGDEPNPFFGMNKTDAGNLLQRMLEDVCDLSTGKCGPWRTPK